MIYLIALFNHDINYTRQYNDKHASLKFFIITTFVCHLVFKSRLLINIKLIRYILVYSFLNHYFLIIIDWACIICYFKIFSFHKFMYSRQVQNVALRCITQLILHVKITINSGRKIIFWTKWDKLIVHICIPYNAILGRKK